MREVETILEETSVLINRLKSTHSYIEYQRAREDLQRHPEQKAMADAFCREVYLAYDTLKEPVSFVEFDDLERKRLKLAAYPEIERYLKAELALCRMLQEIQDKLVFDISFD